MIQDAVLKGTFFRLRPAKDTDAALILTLRRDSSRNAYIHKTDPSVEKQRKWIRQDVQDRRSQYWVVEGKLGKKFHGTISVYQVVPKTKGELGRWILCPDSLAATESLLLAFDFAFGYLKLQLVYMKTAAPNRAVIKLHESYGALPNEGEDSWITLHGKPTKLVYQEVSLSRFQSDVRPQLVAKLDMLAPILSRVQK